MANDNDKPLYERLFEGVQQDPLVCQHCFAITNDEEHVPADRLGEQGIAPMRFSRRYQTVGGKGLPGHTVSEWKPKAVCECGVVSNFAKQRPVTKRDLVSFARNLSATLDDMAERARFEPEDEREFDPSDYGHDEQALVYAVKTFKSKSELQYRDDVLLKRALRVALRRSNDS